MDGLERPGLHLRFSRAAQHRRAARHLADADHARTRRVAGSRGADRIMTNSKIVRLADIAHARSGDKADWVDFGVFAWNAAGYAVLARELTAERVQSHFAMWLPGPVDCWPLPNILAVKLVLRGALQGGGARNLRLDHLGKE